MLYEKKSKSKDPPATKNTKDRQDVMKETHDEVTKTIKEKEMYIQNDKELIEKQRRKIKKLAKAVLELRD